MKSITLLIALLTGLGVAQAQKRQNVYFLKSNGKHLSTKDSADYIRVIQEPDSGTTDFILLEQYANGNQKSRGLVSQFEPVLVYEGQFLRYSKSGKKESLITYVKGKPVAKGYFFFENGKVNKIVDYDSVSSALPVSPAALPTFEMVPYRLDYYADSLGTVMVAEGKGHVKQHKKWGTEEVIEEGDYVGGLKDGLWTETNAAGTYWIKEKFLKGKFLSGESFKDGNTYIYALENEFPVFKGGMDAFYSYLSRSVRYPADAQRAGISGRVFLSFIVEKNGTLSDIKVDRSVSPSIDEEAVRVLRRSPAWIPGKQHGIPVRVKYNIPISFSLNRF